MKVSILTPITRLALLGGAAALGYGALTGGLPINKAHNPVEVGYENPAHVELYKPLNEKGNVEFFMKYDDGKGNEIALPIFHGPLGPLVGDADYHWKSIDTEVKSRLVEESWNEVDSAVRKQILRSELEKMIENYKE